MANSKDTDNKTEEIFDQDDNVSEDSVVSADSDFADTGSGEDKSGDDVTDEDVIQDDNQADGDNSNDNSNVNEDDEDEDENDDKEDSEKEEDKENEDDDDDDDDDEEEEDDDDEDNTKEEGVIVVNKDVPEDAKWYVIHTYSGHENKVAITLQQRAESGGFTNRIFKLFVPQQQKIVVSEGKKRSVDERLFPGYLMVQMLMDDDTWYVVRSTPGVTGFVGMGSTPTPLPRSEVKSLMRFTKMETPKFEAKFTIGDSVKINDGPFRDFLGKVDEVNEEQGKVKVLVSVFGRETPVELDFTQVNRI